MNGISLLVVWAALGVVYSWRDGVDQQREYVLQIEPEILQSLAAGEEILSEVPAEAGNVQRLCITVLPKGSTPAAHTQLAEDRFRQLALSAGRYASSDPALASDAQPTILWPSRANPEQTYGINVGWQPDVKGSLQYFVQLDSMLLKTLAVGDEIYVPIDPSAGRPARFIVKSGKEMLPRIGGAQTQLAQGGAATAPLTGGNRGRFPGSGDTSANSWSNWSSNPTNSTGGLATDYSRQTRPPVTTPGTATDPRQNSLWNSGGNTYTGGNTFSPGGATLNPPTGAYGDHATGQFSGQQYPPPLSPGAYGQPPAATGSNFDKYRHPNAPAYDVANSSLYPPQGNGQQQTMPQISRNTTQQPFDTRLTGGTGLPNGTNVLGAAGVLPPGTQPPAPDKPWGPLLFITFALFFSIGGNLYLAYTALEFHSRYRNAIERLRSAARSA